MVERIRVGVVGHGYFGAFHARHYEAHDEVELVAIADPTPSAAEAIQAAYNRRHVDDYRQLIGKVDAVSIAAPTGMHEAIATDFIEAGVHVLVEKPLCQTAEAAARVTALAAAKGVVLNVGHIERFSPVYRRLRDEIASPIRQFDVHRIAPWRGRILDVDVVLDMMIHDIDLVLNLAGSEPVSVAASGVEMMGHGLDAVLARVAFASGAMAHISASRIAPKVSRVMTIAETGRTLTADFGAGTLAVFTAADKDVREDEVPRADALRGEIDAFLAAVAGEREAGGVDGFAATRALALADRIRAACLGVTPN